MTCEICKDSVSETLNFNNTEICLDCLSQLAEICVTLDRNSIDSIKDIVALLFFLELDLRNSRKTFEKIRDKSKLEPIIRKKLELLDSIVCVLDSAPKILSDKIIDLVNQHRVLISVYL